MFNTKHVIATAFSTMLFASTAAFAEPTILHQQTQPVVKEQPVRKTTTTHKHKHKVRVNKAKEATEKLNTQEFNKVSSQNNMAAQQVKDSSNTPVLKK